jgi:hypothetical protein
MNSHAMRAANILAAIRATPLTLPMRSD